MWKQEVLQLPKMPLPLVHRSPHQLSLLFFSAKMTQKLYEKTPIPVTAHHAIFHIIVIRKKAAEKNIQRWRKNEKNRAKYNKKIFLLISFDFFLLSLSFHRKKRSFERMSKAGFLLTSTQTTLFARDPWHKMKTRRRRKRLKGKY